MKKIITLILALTMVFCICGCKNGEDNLSSEIVETVYEEIVMNEDGTEVTGPDSIVSSNNSSSDNQTTSSGNNSTTTSSTAPAVIDYDTVVEVDICEEIVRLYLDATDPKTQYTFLSQYGESSFDYQYLPLEWVGDGSHTYKVYISENADFSDAYVMGASGYKPDNTGICVPGKTYYWKVVGVYYDEPLAGGKIKIKDAPVRWIKLDGVNNVRDMGGWKTESGKTVSYEKIYRGAMLDEITQKGLNTLSALGIKTDIDVRSTADWDTHSPVEKTGLKYYFIDSDYSYEGILNEYKADTIGSNLQELFKLLADESNYPIYLHCGGGTDRTGTYSFILNGLLGVSYEDLTRDYELTSYAGADRWRGNGKGGTFAPDDLIHENVSNSQVDATWGVLNKKFMESEYCTDGKLSSAIENFLLDRGVKQEDIDAYKNIMLK